MALLPCLAVQHGGVLLYWICGADTGMDSAADNSYFCFKVIIDTGSPRRMAIIEPKISVVNPGSC